MRSLIVPPKSTSSSIANEPNAAKVASTELSITLSPSANMAGMTIAARPARRSAARSRSRRPSHCSGRIICRPACPRSEPRRAGSVHLRRLERHGGDRHVALLHDVHAELRAAHEALADLRLVIRERLRAIVIVERLAIAPLLHGHEMTGVVEGLGEDVGDATRGFSYTRLRGLHQLAHPLATWDLRVDISERDEHVRLLQVSLDGVLVAGARRIRVLTGAAECPSLAQQVPAAVQFHRDVLQAPAVGLERLLADRVPLLAAGQRMLLVNQRLDTGQDRLVVHAPQGTQA